MGEMTGKIVGVDVRGIASMRGHEGDAYRALLCVGGKPVADVYNDGNGGGTWPEAIYDRKRWEELEAQVAKLPPDQTEYGALDVSMDYFLSSLCEEALDRKRLNRLASKATLFRTPDMRPGDWKSVSGPQGEPARQWVLARHPDATFYVPTVEPKAPKRPKVRV